MASSRSPAMMERPGRRSTAGPASPTDLRQPSGGVAHQRNVLRRARWPPEQRLQDVPHETTDYGRSWTAINSNLPEGSVHVIREHPRTSSLLFVGTEYAPTSLDGGGRGRESATACLRRRCTTWRSTRAITIPRRNARARDLHHGRHLAARASRDRETGAGGASLPGRVGDAIRAQQHAVARLGGAFVQWRESAGGRRGLVSPEERAAGWDGDAVDRGPVGRARP